MKKFLSIFLMFVILAFMLLSPALIAEGVNKNIFSIKQERREKEYRGNIVFWHVVSFKTGEGSGYSMLKARSARFERNTPYVFVELLGMTPEEAEKRLSAGERPDVISFPKGFMDESGFAAAPENELVAERLSTLQDRSYPYMFDSYVLLTNGELFYESGIQLPYGGYMTKEVFYAALDRIGNASDGVLALSLCDTYGVDVKNAIEYESLSDEESGMLENISREIDYASLASGAEVFLDGTSAMHICPYSEYKSILKDKRAQSMSITCYPFSNYTDLVQCVGVYESEDKAKEEMCLRLAGTLLSAGFQKQLESIEMLPVLFFEDIYEDNYARKEEYLRLMEQGVFG